RLAVSAGLLRCTLLPKQMHACWCLRASLHVPLGLSAKRSRHLFSFLLQQVHKRKTMPAILVDGLCKTYRSFRKAPGLLGAVRSLIWREHVLREAVREISFTIEEGEVVGFLGPNGAGKTTTLKMLSGILHPSKGRAEVLGFTPSQRPFAYLRQIS